MPQAIQNGKLEFRVGEGQEVFSFKPKGASACKFYGTGGKELCKLAYSGDKLKVKSADDQPLFELKPKQDKVMIKDATGEKELFKFKLKGDRIDFYLPGDKRTYRLKKRDYGWRLDDNHDNTLFRAKRNDQKSGSARRPGSDRTLFQRFYSNLTTPVFSHRFTEPGTTGSLFRILLPPQIANLRLPRFHHMENKPKPPIQTGRPPSSVLK